MFANNHQVGMVKWTMIAAGLTSRTCKMSETKRSVFLATSASALMGVLGCCYLLLVEHLSAYRAILLLAIMLYTLATLILFN
jgi:hypothetical protein